MAIETKTKKAVVCGAGGFIGHHLVRFLKEQGYWVRGVDLKYPEFGSSAADEFLILDLRQQENCKQALTIEDFYQAEFDEVYQLAADMGGMGFIHSAECEIMRNSALINIHVLHEAARKGIKNYFFSSSACVYRDMSEDEEFIDETSAYPALPDNEYGWEKLYAERTAFAYGRKFNMQIRVARFQNCYGEEGTWCGGREKAPAALSRKVAELENAGTIEVWGDGTAMRSYTHVDDMVRGIYLLMQSNLQEPVNIGSEEFVSVNQLVGAIAKASGKKVSIKHIEGPVGVQARNHLFEKIKDLGWRAEVSVEQGMARLYPWIAAQVQLAKKRGKDTSVVEDFSKTPRALN